MKSIVKAVTWRIVAASTTLVTVYAMTGDISAAGSVAAMAGGIKMFLYVVHDKAYDHWWPAREAVKTI